MSTGITLIMKRNSLWPVGNPVMRMLTRKNTEHLLQDFDLGDQPCVSGIFGLGQELACTTHQEH